RARWIRLGMMVTDSLIVCMTTVPECLRIGVAQYDAHVSIDWRQHEARGDERPQAEHRQDEGSSPMRHSTGPRSIGSSWHHCGTMPDPAYRRKVTAASTWPYSPHPCGLYAQDQWTFCTGGRFALICDTPSAPAILQMGCEKSFCRLGTVTSPL